MTQASTLRASNPGHILAVDDDQDMLGLYRTCLTAAGHRVTQAVDGLAGFNQAVADPPDVIILDLVMAGISGLEVSDRLRADPVTADIPILMISGKSETEDRVESLQRGADDYLTKPFDYTELVARVEALLRRSSRSAAATAAAAALDRSEPSPEDIRRLATLRSALREGDVALVPRYDVRTGSGYTYPALEEIDGHDDHDPLADLAGLHDQGYLERVLHDVVLLCPRCRHHDLHIREVCPSCRSPDLRPEASLHHYRCAFVGPEKAFFRGAQLVCPKCRQELRHIGVEYEKSEDALVCASCDYNFQEAAVAVSCRQCEHAFPPENATRRRVYRYRVTSLGRQAVQAGVLLSTDAGPAIHDQDTGIYRFEMFREMVRHEVSRGTALNHSTALLQVRARSRPEPAASRQDRDVSGVLAEVVNVIRSELPYAVLGRGAENSLLVLLPATDRDRAVAASERIPEAYANRADPALSAGTELSVTWHVQPDTVPDAQALLAAACGVPADRSPAPAGQES